jgi:hypothetical protein
MQYWVDRVRVSSGPYNVTVTPVSFVAPTEFHEQLQQLIAPEDEIVSFVHEAKKDWTFVIKSGDVFPVQIIASIETTLSSEVFDAMDFPVVYRGWPVDERRFFRTRGDYFVKTKATIPIFNLNILGN